MAKMSVAQTYEKRRARPPTRDVVAATVRRVAMGSGMDLFRVEMNFPA